MSPWRLFEGARAVYVVTSQLGFEAILAGHRPQVFGKPWYAGWGLSDDRQEIARRLRHLSAAQLAAAMLIMYPLWYDPYRKAPGQFETVLDTLEARARAWREDRKGYRAWGMSSWKHPHLRAMFGDVRFSGEKGSRRAMVWASKQDTGAPPGAIRVEDGFLRSRGLGASLVPPLSQVADAEGIYYDPRRPSALERMIAAREQMTAAERLRAQALIDRITDLGLSKYNLGDSAAEVTARGNRTAILVPGQVEDDASLRTQEGGVLTNAALLRKVRADNPDALVIYKPHPDVEAGLRKGEIGSAAVEADLIARNTDPAALIEQVDEVWTMTSLLGFEALLRGRRVTCLATPFFAGWGLTRDLGLVPERRKARPELEGLVHATLIDYPRYLDPKTRTACPVEVAVDRLAEAAVLPRAIWPRLLSPLQALRGFWSAKD